MTLFYRHLLIISILFFNPLTAQFSGSKSKSKSTDEPKKNTKKKDIKTITKDCVEYKGLFNFYQNEETSKSFLEIDTSQINKEFIYFSYVEDGVLDSRNVRGRFRGSKIIKIQKYFNKIDFVVENYSYYFDPESPLSNSKNANINQPIIISEEILGFNSDSSSFLINADNVFLSENLQQVKSSYSSSYRGFKLGSLNKSKTRYHKVNNYPENTDVIVDYVYESKYPQKYGSKAITDSRVVGMRIQHSLIEIPDNNFKPRFDDPRVGYFHTQTNDMTTIDQINYRDMIHRWDLKKKNPELELSEPVNPIVWWIENTTPIEFRSIIKKGVESWNIAFEKAGFLNAIQVKVQPDTALWDAGDIRYNVLRWTSSPQPPWGGYGPSFVNPKTGQILGADIMLEWVYITNRIKYDYLFNESDFNSEYSDHNDHLCIAANELQLQNNFGLDFIEFKSLGEEMKKELVNQSLQRLVLHEVGHTLGLSHNFKGSTLLSVDELNNKNIVAKKGICSSVMEYPAINITKNPDDQGLFYDIVPGPYDCWAIEFGYSDFSDQKELESLSKILSRSTNKDLVYANDADDMRYPGKGIDPNAMINDLSSDPVLHSKERMDMIKEMLQSLKSKYTAEGTTYERLKKTYFSLLSQYFRCLDIISRQIGGVNVDRSFISQNSEIKPFSPVEVDLQKYSVQLIKEYGFENQEMFNDSDLFSHLQSQRRGFNFRSSGEDPKILPTVLNRQKLLLSHLLNKNVLQRINNSSLYGNEYSLTEYMIDLRNAVFRSDLYSNVSLTRRNLQVEYIDFLIRLVSDKSNYDNMSKTSAFYNLNWLKSNLDKEIGNLTTRQHREYLLYKIDDIIEN